ncbi:hypothetical protein EOD42_14140 [Rhodovarius crocodyli]|uniref:Uncharacterized protein n=1 Tax=Rhodovarius crocodyli TaxID=1979269 RepID=A0A437MF16_9PROT|nr:hypothetical protein [Rhodovarius crocodyli]RVT96248.1 hypothetical protein EOD42_14140 [Rhodovarius crocodyli]
MTRPPAAREGLWASAAGPRFVQMLGPHPDLPDMILISCDEQELTVPASAVHALPEGTRELVRWAMEPAPDWDR